MRADKTKDVRSVLIGVHLAFIGGPLVFLFDPEGLSILSGDATLAI